jgi:hypothetical protein
MRSYKSASTILVALLVTLLLPLVAVADVNTDDLPDGASWYFHADLKEMRDSSTGEGLYAWLDDEVFEEIRDESGIDITKEVDRVTAFATQGQGAVMVVDGRFSQQTRDKSLVAAAAAERFDTLKSGGKTYYHVQGDQEIDADKVHMTGIDNEFYFSYAIDNKLVLAAQKEQMESLLGNNGRIPGAGGHKGALFVLTAERSLIQAGIDTKGFYDASDDDGGFESNILRNTQHVAVLVADVAGKLAIEAQLVAAEPEMAQSLASIVRGLIALQAFSEDMDPTISQFLQGTRVDVNDTALKISVALAPEAFVALLDD